MDKNINCSKCNKDLSGGEGRFSEFLNGDRIYTCTKCGLGKKKSNKNRTAQASILCQNKGFQIWLNDQIKFKTGVRVTCKDQARESVRVWCEVDSLSQLNQELEPVNRFNRLVALFE